MKPFNTIRTESTAYTAVSRKIVSLINRAASPRIAAINTYAMSIVLSTALGAIAAQAEEADCIAVSQSVFLEVSEDKSKVLGIVSRQVAATPGCACEIVKSAIKASEGDSRTVAAIVEVAISMAPGHMRLISQCAIATAPDALADIQAVIARLDPGSGDFAEGSKSGKDAKAGMVAPAEAPPNPLDFFPLLPPPLPPVIDPPLITDPNPAKS